MFNAHRFKTHKILLPSLSLSILPILPIGGAIAAKPTKPDQLCKTNDFSALAQALMPSTPEATDKIPPSLPLNIPQRPESVVPQQPLSLSLPTAIQLAFDRNPDLEAAKLQFERRCAQLKQAKAANLPTLSTSGSVSHTGNGASFSPQRREYDASSASQTQVQDQNTAELQNQQAIAQQDFQTQLQELQDRFQQSATQVQRDTLQQQLSQLQQRADTTASLPDPVSFSPITASDVALSLRSGANAGGSGSFFDGSVDLTYAIYTGGQRDASIKSARKQVENSVLEVQRQLQRLRQQVTAQYYDLQQTQALIEVAASAVQNAQENLRTVQLSEQAGVRTKFEVLQAAVTLADDQQNQSQANALYSIARRQLVQQLNLPDNQDVTLPANTRAQRADSWSLSLEDSIVLALNNRIELNQLKLQREITQQQRRIALGQKLPQLQSFASFNVADDLEDRYTGSYGYAVGIQVSLDVFSGGSVRAQVKQLDQALAVIDQQFGSLKEGIRFEVEQAYFSLKANETNVDTANQALTQAQEGLRLAQLRLQAGVGTTSEVTRSQADLTQAQGNLVAAILNYNRALASLELATGYANSTPSKL